eukprot:4980067-Lingulodinium_polyedra.AAC.1
MAHTRARRPQVCTHASSPPKGTKQSTGRTARTEPQPAPKGGTGGAAPSSVDDTCCVCKL